MVQWKMTLAKRKPSSYRGTHIPQNEPCLLAKEASKRFNPRACWLCWVSIKLQPFSSVFMITSSCQNAYVPLISANLVWTSTEYHIRDEERSSFQQFFHCMSLTAASLVVAQRKQLYMLSSIVCKRRSKGRFNAPWTTTQAQTACSWTSQAAA